MIRPPMASPAVAEVGRHHDVALLDERLHLGVAQQPRGGLRAVLRRHRGGRAAVKTQRARDIVVAVLEPSGKHLRGVVRGLGLLPGGGRRGLGARHVRLEVLQPEAVGGFDHAPAAAICVRPCDTTTSEVPDVTHGGLGVSAFKRFVVLTVHPTY